MKEELGEKEIEEEAVEEEDVEEVEVVDLFLGLTYRATRLPFWVMRSFLTLDMATWGRVCR